jgi:hypothetical protein
VAAFVYFPDTQYDRLFPLVTAALMSIAAYFLQHSMIDDALEKGGTRKSFWKLGGVIIASLSVMLVSIVAVMAAFDVRFI